MTGNMSSPKIKAIVLYGSHARGDSDSESDLDVCVFTEDKRKVSAQEIEWAQEEVTRVLERLRKLSDELGHLAALKAALETGH